eukprot:TRINITY_DN3789_c1_g1_i3.p1 TRINITY_DN3789_c1_g1~~TRINITY_DN3789_c1_g1_i3.p1  ORF type:complete len:412 (+),score=32.16 TRINITY_DN3789_c1_g1_i3:16-1251(+)
MFTRKDSNPLAREPSPRSRTSTNNTNNNTDGHELLRVEEEGCTLPPLDEASKPSLGRKLLRKDSVQSYGKTTNFVYGCPVKCETTIAQRCGHSGVLYEDGVYVFGGICPTTELSPPVYVFMLATCQWHTIPPVPATASGATPCGRSFHSAVIDTTNATMYIFGGKSNGYLNDVWCFNIKTNLWQNCRVDGKRPTRRYAQTCIFYDGSIYMFGGFDTDSFKCNDTWQFDLASCTWTELCNGQSKLAPSARFRHSATLVNNEMIVFGGQSDDSCDAIWAFHLVAHTWRKIEPLVKLPCVWGHSLVKLSTPEPVFYVLGGASHPSAEKSTKKSQEMAIYQFDLDSNSWNVVRQKGEPPPPSTAQLILPMPGEKMFLFGGTNEDTPFNHIYILFVHSKKRMYAWNCPRHKKKNCH